ncbi:MAG: AAA family ATPase [Candidatus Anstonellales archaeon]
MVELDRLYRIALENAAAVSTYRKRFAYEKLKELVIKRSSGKFPIVLLSGIRGVGKTTLMLQLFSEMNGAFYFSADSILVKTSTIYAIVEQAYREGYDPIFIDEIHRYPRWIEESKNIYDDFGIRVIASGSSTAAIKKGGILLGRRAVDFQLPLLTFGEFFYLRENERYSATMDEVVNKKSAIRWLAAHPKVDRYYKNYFSTGGFPMTVSEKGAIFKLIKRMIYEDALAEFSLTKNKVDVAERLLGFLSLSKPGEFSYTSFSSMSGYAKSTVYEAISMLKELEILRSIEEKTPKSEAKGTMKLLFSHPNLRSAFAEQLMKEPEFGALREEYFLFHMASLGHPIFIPKKMKKNPDYIVKLEDSTLIFEIGGGSKTAEQLGKKGVVMDDNSLMVLGFVQKTDQK